jgi:hypothetical protein
VAAIYFLGDPVEEPAEAARAALRNEREGFWSVARGDRDD